MNINLKKKEFKLYSVLVIGDTCVDKFVYGDTLRLAPEAPVPIFNPSYENTNKGMAGNVVANLQSLGINTYFLGNEECIVKTRYVDDRTGHILLRVDENDKVKRIDSSILQSIKNNHYKNQKIDAIVISDYNKGFLDEEDIQFICENNKNVFIDTKKILDEWCVNASFIKINNVEYEHTEYSLKNLDLEDKLVITLSNKGCKYKNKLFPVKKVEIRDVSGAGDTFMSGLVSEYILTKDIEASIIFAQECATIVVQKPGVSTI
jgi:D-beta-D-heptose 7-phosphate kinase/D-beta-D-heptose 1-phosphate adenosyltransferase